MSQMSPKDPDSYGEMTPEEFSKPPSLWDNCQTGGQSPRSHPTQSQPQRRLFTIGTRGQERGEEA